MDGKVLEGPPPKPLEFFDITQEGEKLIVAKKGIRLSCQRLKNWFDERYDFEGIRSFLKQKVVPVHKYSILYYTGGLTLFLFILQFITGMVLAFYYVPYHEQAHKSIIEIVTKLNMGWLFRSLHHWGAQIAIGVLFIHVFGTLLVKAYRKPREIIWVTGFILLVISIFFGLSGYFLLWDERAFCCCQGRHRWSRKPSFYRWFYKIIFKR